jgi:hypothetical protein
MIIMNPITGSLTRPEVKIARILMVVIFLALIRTIAEMFRLQAEQSHFSYQQVRMCVSGALTAAIGLFIMVLLSFWSKHWIIIFLGGITLFLLVMIKEGLR